MWRYLLRYGVKEEEIEWFRENPCPPGVVGVNHYLTSDRFLDDQLHLYPAGQHASAGPFHFVDVEAVRRCAACDVSVEGVLRDVWSRYGIPVAITETHLGCTREEQMRWFAETVSGAWYLARQGVDVRAVTAWSLLGAFNWNVLVTRDCGHYEPGVFDVRGSQPRPTALAGMVRDYADGKISDHPVLQAPGWWRRPERLMRTTAPKRPQWSGQARPLVILGSDRLGSVFAELCNLRGIRHLLLDSPRAETDPWAIIDCWGAVRNPMAWTRDFRDIALVAFTCDEAAIESARDVPRCANSQNRRANGGGTGRRRAARSRSSHRRRARCVAATRRHLRADYRLG